MSCILNATSMLVKTKLRNIHGIECDVDLPTRQTSAIPGELLASFMHFIRRKYLGLYFLKIFILGRTNNRLFNPSLAGANINDRRQICTGFDFKPLQKK